MEPILVIMAAGMGSRYGGNKQLDRITEQGDIIMDFSLYDAYEAGFRRVCFIIKHDFEEVFKAHIENGAGKKYEVYYAFQEGSDLPEGFTFPEGRTKPWGTGQAVLSARNIIDAPFAVINADDYYGKVAFKELHNFLITEAADTKFCMAGFQLKNTLSDNGGVTRGVCQVNADNYLTDVVETGDIVKTADGGAATGDKILDADGAVSMNFWGLTPAYLPMLEADFVTFLQGIGNNPLKAEYLLPGHIGDLLKQGKVSVKVLPTPDKWFGVTYAEDKPLVIASFKELIDAGEYEQDLFSDL